MAKYIRWDGAAGRYIEIVGLPDNDTANDGKSLEYDDTTGTWVAGGVLSNKHWTTTLVMTEVNT